MAETKNKSFTERLDRFIGIFFPKIEFQRRMYRIANNFALKGSYAGASRDRLRNSWLPQGGSADEDLLADLPDLRERSRDLSRNDGVAAGIISTMLSNIVGTGITLQSRIDKESLGVSEEEGAEFQRKIERAWQKWEPYADTAGRMSLWEIQSLIERQIITNGESLIGIEMVDEPQRPYFLALNVIEADRLGTPSDKTSNKSIRKGVELGSRGQPVAYWICKTHPGDVTYSRKSPDSKEYIRYEAFNQYGRPNILHLYWVKRPGQTRGEPFFSPVLNKFKDLADYMEAELVAARVAACFALFIKKTNAFDTAFNRSSGTENNKRLEEMEPGMIEYLNLNEDITSFNPQRPGSQFDPFVDKVLRFIGAGLNLPYELVIKDFSKTNYSSARAAILEARKFFKCEQQWISEKFCQPIYELFVDESYLRGEFEAVNYFEKRLDWTRGKWIAPGWGYIDPEKEINAASESIVNNLSTLADECAAHGRDWEEVLEQRQREETKRKELGLLDPKEKEKTDKEQNPQEEMKESYS